MSSSDDEASSPETGASGGTDPGRAMPENDSESDDDDDDLEGKTKRTLKKDSRPWESVAMFRKGEAAVHDAEEIKQLIYESAKKIMEDSGLIKLSTHRPKPSDLHL